MLSEIKKYVQELKDKEAKLVEELNQVRAELRDINEVTALVKPQITRNDVDLNWKGVFPWGNEKEGHRPVVFTSQEEPTTRSSKK